MKFQCECGKEFDNPQSFNGHKSHCSAHQLAKYGNLDKLTQANKVRSQLGGKTNSKNIELKKLKALSQWVSEDHRCEHCGKVMIEKFGSGRFCSRTCANSHKHSEETKQKIFMQIRKYNNPKKVCSICSKKLHGINKTSLCANCLNNTAEGKQFKTALGQQGYATMKANGTHKP